MHARESPDFFYHALYLYLEEFLRSCINTRHFNQCAADSSAKWIEHKVVKGVIIFTHTFWLNTYIYQCDITRIKPHVRTQLEIKSSLLIPNVDCRTFTSCILAYKAIKFWWEDNFVERIIWAATTFKGEDCCNSVNQSGCIEVQSAKQPPEYSL